MNEICVYNLSSQINFHLKLTFYQILKYLLLLFDFNLSIFLVF